jgi:hypothetical protein
MDQTHFPFNIIIKGMNQIETFLFQTECKSNLIKFNNYLLKAKILD